MSSQDPETLTAGILHHAARADDLNLASCRHPLCFAIDGEDLVGFDLIAAMDNLMCQHHSRRFKSVNAG